MRKVKEIGKAALASGVILLTSVASVFAATNLDEVIRIEPRASSAFAGLENITIPGIVSGGITLALIIAAVIFFFMLVIGGIRWILSGGDKAQTEGARGQITAALVGLVIVFSAWAILQLIRSLFGIDFGPGFELPKFTP